MTMRRSENPFGHDLIRVYNGRLVIRPCVYRRDIVPVLLFGFAAMASMVLCGFFIYLGCLSMADLDLISTLVFLLFVTLSGWLARGMFVTLLKMVPRELVFNLKEKHIEIRYFKIFRIAKLQSPSAIELLVEVVRLGYRTAPGIWVYFRVREGGDVYYSFHLGRVPNLSAEMRTFIRNIVSEISSLTGVSVLKVRCKNI